jgi:serine/threonine protein kinase
MKESCDNWKLGQDKMIKALKQIAGTGGNLVVPVEVFRVGNQFCKSTKRVKMDFIKTADIAKLSDDQKLLLLKTMSHSLRTLHRAGIVHGDLKPDNILISHSSADNLITKITDFDDSYFEGKPPAPEETLGTESYYSPELARYIIEADPIKGNSISCKSDIFAMGLIFHEYVTGKKPEFDGFSYAWEALTNGVALTISSAIAPELSELISHMLLIESADRPDMDAVFAQLQKATRVTNHSSMVSIENSNIVKIDYINNGQYRIHFESGISRIVPFIYIKTKKLESYMY